MSHRFFLSAKQKRQFFIKKSPTHIDSLTICCILWFSFSLSLTHSRRRIIYIAARTIFAKERQEMSWKCTENGMCLIYISAHHKRIWIIYELRRGRFNERESVFHFFAFTWSLRLCVISADMRWWSVSCLGPSKREKKIEKKYSKFL